MVGIRVKERLYGIFVMLVLLSATAFVLLIGYAILDSYPGGRDIIKRWKQLSGFQADTIAVDSLKKTQIDTSESWKLKAKVEELEKRVKVLERKKGK